MPSHLRLYASDEVRKAADAIFPAIADAMQALADARRDGHQRPYDKASQTLIKLILVLENAVQQTWSILVEGTNELRP